MKIAITTQKGLEEFLVEELKDLGFEDVQVENFAILLETSDENIAKILYLSNLATNILKVDSFSQFKDLKDLIKKIKIHPIKNKTKIECDRTGEHNFTSQDVKKEVSKKISGSDYETFENTAKIIIRDNFFLAGIDLVGFDISKREYNLFIHPSTIKPLTAVGAYYMTSKKGIYLDPFSLSGIIPIEIAFKKNNLSTRFFSKKFIFEKLMAQDFSSYFKELDKKVSNKKEIFSLDRNFKNISNQKKNAKIAGVEKMIEFSKTSLEDIDLKFFEKNVDVIITKPLEVSKRIPESVALKFYEKFYEQTKIVGVKEIVLIIEKPEFLNKTNFKIIRQVETYQGNRKICVVKVK